METTFTIHSLFYPYQNIARKLRYNLMHEENWNINKFLMTKFIPLAGQMSTQICIYHCKHS